MKRTTSVKPASSPTTTAADRDQAIDALLENITGGGGATCFYPALEGGATCFYPAVDGGGDLR
jgi:hypothetical protein